MSNPSILDVLGREKIDQQVEELLAEILKVLSLKHVEFKEDSKLALEHIEEFIQIVPHLDQKKKGKEKVIQYLLNLRKSIKIAELPGIPPGYIDDLDIPKINYETTLLQLITVFKRPDSRIITDLGMDIKKSEQNYLKRKKSNKADDGGRRVL